MQQTIPTADDIRAAMMNSAKSFKDEFDWSWSAMGMKAVGDSKFFPRIESGSNFNVETYQRVMDWLDRTAADIRRAAPERKSA